MRDPTEYFWRELGRMQARPCHEPREMRSAQSHGPVRSFLCDDRAAWTGLTLVWDASAATPVCLGSRRTWMPLEQEQQQARAADRLALALARSALRE